MKRGLICVAIFALVFSLSFVYADYTLEYCQMFDLTDDGFIDSYDSAIVLGCFGDSYNCEPPTYQTGKEECCAANFDGSSDSFVGPGDFSGFAGYFGMACDCLCFPECGNSVVEPGEECDDGGTADGDGCDSECLVDWSCPIMESGVPVGTIPSPIDEASGIAASRENEGVLWVIQDDWGPYVYALEEDGTLLGRYRVGTNGHDVEDIAIGPGPTPGVDYLYIGHIGDNDNCRPSVGGSCYGAPDKYVRRVAEPDVDVGQDYEDVVLSTFDAIWLEYPVSDFPSHKDSETLMADPITADIYLVTKRAVPNKIYVAEYPQSTSSMNTMEFVSNLPATFNGNGAWSAGPTGGDISPDGSQVLIRQYTSRTPDAAVWYRPAGTDLVDIDFSGDRCDYVLVSRVLGEAIGWDANSEGFYSTSEYASAPIYYYERDYMNS